MNVILKQRDLELQVRLPHAMIQLLATFFSIILRINVI